MSPKPPLWTGLESCYDASGAPVDCTGTGQDAAHRPGLAWPEPRFEIADEGLVHDALTGLVWLRNANAAVFAIDWPEALDHVAAMNESGQLGHADWRLPNRRELRSLLSCATRSPALPVGHPFLQVNTGWYWTSTTSAMAPAYAWRVQMDGGRMFYGKKTDYALVWPVRGESAVLPATGQTQCYGLDGNVIDCDGNPAGLQDGAMRTGAPWPRPRFHEDGDDIHDALTDLVWTRSANLARIPTSWPEALDLVAAMADAEGRPWRLPTINELESLVDASRHSPALPRDNPFTDWQEAYWSSTTSGYEPDWAYCLYLHKGAVGVGFKRKAEFSVWAVRDRQDPGADGA
jgi:hypothetical protein